MVKKIRLLLLALLSGLLLGLAWEKYFTVLIFIALVPLLFIADEFFWGTDEVGEMRMVGSRKQLWLIPVPDVKRKGLRKFGLYYLAFLTWNLITTWWVYNASPAAFLAWTLNSLFMALTLSLAGWVKKKFGSPFALFVIIPFWLSFEYLHQHWDLSWTWLTLGNAFACQNELVQWYELTGTSGGSAWIWTVNLLVFFLLKKRLAAGAWSRKQSLVLAGVLIVPCILSYVLYISVDSRIASSALKKQKVIVVQPNIDPYNEKFVADPQLQIDKTLDLIAKSARLDSAAYLVLPETFLIDNIWEDQLQDASAVLYLREKLIDPHPGLSIITGGNTLKQYMAGEERSATAHKFTQEEGYYDAYNAALQIDKTKAVQTYHKSILVPGAEIMPFLSLFPWLEKYALDLGGTVGSLGLQKERSVFTSASGIHVAPIICYESVYPEYVSAYVKNGANILCIITNDGWWGDTPGYRQHLVYGALRAIETRKPMARSANTGISCFVDEKGRICHATGWWEPAVIESTLTPNTYQTLFVRWGDWPAKTSLVMAVVLSLLGVYRRFRKR